MLIPEKEVTHLMIVNIVQTQNLLKKQKFNAKLIINYELINDDLNFSMNSHTSFLIKFFYNKLTYTVFFSNNLFIINVFIIIYIMYSLIIL